MKQQIATTAAPAAIGPYSQAIRTGNLVFVSGQLPIDAATGTMPEEIKAQTRQSLENVVKTTVFLADMSLFGPMNEVYAEYFGQPYPARCAFAVKELPKQALVEIEVIAAC